MCGHSDLVGRSAIAARRRLYSSTSRSYVRCRSPRGRDTWSGSVGTRRSRHCSVNRLCGIGLPPDCAGTLTGPFDVSNRSGPRDYSHQCTEHTLRAITLYQHRSFRPWSRPRLTGSHNVVDCVALRAGPEHANELRSALNDSPLTLNESCEEHIR